MTGRTDPLVARAVPQTAYNSLIRNRSVRGALILAALIGLALIFREPLNDLLLRLTRRPQQVAPAAWLAVLFCVLYIGAAGWLAVQTVRALGRRFTLGQTARAIGVWPYVLNAVLTGGLLLLASAPKGIERGALDDLTVLGVLSGALPLILGLQAAILVSADDEPMLELHLSYPRSFVWYVVERLAVALALHMLIGLAITALAVASARTEFVTGFRDAVLRWLPPALLLAGIGLRISLGTRQIVFGAATLIGVWFAFQNFGQAVLMRFPYLWPLHPFLPASAPNYLLNRGLIALIGLALMISALSTLRDSEWLFTGRYTVRFPGRRATRTARPSQTEAI